ncbi:MAG: hypothetical protein ACLPSW_29585 [Roseiarcus sp.]
MTKPPMENADKFCWTGPGQVQVIDFDPASVTPAYALKLEQTVNDSDMEPSEKLIALGYIRDKHYEVLFHLLAEYEIPLPSWRA